MTEMKLPASFLLLLLSALSLLGGCMGFHSDESGSAPRPVRLSGRIWQDSVRHDSVMQLWIDRHGELLHYELPVSRGSFSWQGETNDIDELRLFDTRGGSWHMYGGPNWELEIEIDSLGRLVHLGSDTVNTWLADMDELMRSTDSKSLRIHWLDSTCRADTGALRCALLLLRMLPQVEDSIMVRRLQGSLSAKAQPAWMVTRLEEYLDAASRIQSGRLPDFSFVSPDTVFRTHEIGYTGKMFLFWAAWDSVSVDSMRSVTRRVARDFGLYGEKAVKSRHSKRMEIATVCLSATDSARWQSLLRDVPGRHALYPAGFSDPRVRKWKISTVPYIVVIDAYGNVYGQDVWGEKLDRELSRFADVIPKKTDAVKGKTHLKSHSTRNRNKVKPL